MIKKQLIIFILLFNYINCSKSQATPEKIAKKAIDKIFETIIIVAKFIWKKKTKIIVIFISIIGLSKLYLYFKKKNDILINTILNKPSNLINLTDEQKNFLNDKYTDSFFHNEISIQNYNYLIQINTLNNNK
jgi:hypothetical protein